MINLACRDRFPHQLDLAQFNAVRQQLAPPHEIPHMARGLSAGGPFWLHFAATTYAQYAYRTAAGIEGAEASRTRVTGPAAHTTRSLSSTSTRAGYNVNYSQSRALGFLAVEFMAELAGEAALFDYYRHLPDSESWEEAFERAFGMLSRLLRRIRGVPRGGGPSAAAPGGQSRRAAPHTRRRRTPGRQ